MKCLVLLCCLAAAAAAGAGAIVESGSCEMCTESVASLRFMLTKPFFKTAIKTFLETLCKGSGPVVFICDRGVAMITNRVFAKLEEILAKYTDDEVCKVFHLCSRLETLRRAVTTCDVCVDTVEDMKVILGMKELETLAQDFTAISCSYVSVELLRHQCEVFYKDFIREWFYYWRISLKEYNSKQLCSSIHFCTLSDSSVPLSDSRVPLSDSRAPLSEQHTGPICLLCEDGVRLTRHVVTDPHFEKMVNSDVKFACRFTSFLHSRCEGFVDTLTRTLFVQVRSILEDADDHNTCSLFLLCGAADTNKTTVCDVCKAAFEEARDVVTSQALQSLVTSEAELACVVYGPFRRLCVYEAHQIIVRVFETLHKMDDISSQGFCSKFHLCKRGY